MSSESDRRPCVKTVFTLRTMPRGTEQVDGRKQVQMRNAPTDRGGLFVGGDEFRAPSRCGRRSDCLQSRRVRYIYDGPLWEKSPMAGHVKACTTPAQGAVPPPRQGRRPTTLNKSCRNE